MQIPHTPWARTRTRTFAPPTQSEAYSLVTGVRFSQKRPDQVKGVQFSQRRPVRSKLGALSSSALTVARTPGKFCYTGTSRHTPSRYRYITARFLPRFDGCTKQRLRGGEPPARDPKRGQLAGIVDEWQGLTVERMGNAEGAGKREDWISLATRRTLALPSFQRLSEYARSHDVWKHGPRGVCRTVSWDPTPWPDQMDADVLLAAGTREGGGHSADGIV